MSDATSKLDQHDNSLRRREDGDFKRTGDGSPYYWDGVSLRADGEPKLRRAGRSSGAGKHVKPEGFALQRHKEVTDFVATALMMDVAHSKLGPYPELWVTRDKHTRMIIDSLLVEGRERAGAFTKAKRGTLVHLVLELVAQAIVDGTDPADIDLDEMVDEAIELGMTLEVLEQSRDLFIEFFDLYAEPLFTEARCVHVGYNFAGTADLVLRWKQSPGPGIEAGDITGGDLKTGRADTFTKVSQCAQLAAYFGPGAQRYEIVDEDDPGRPVDWPDELRRDVAVIVQLPLDTAIDTGRLVIKQHIVDLTAGVEVLDRALMMRDFDVPDHQRSTLPELQRNLTDSALLRDLTASVIATKHEQVLDWLAGRIKTIVEHPKGVQMLLEWWPDELPRDAVKARTLEPDQVAPIHRLVSHVEAELHLPFLARDPRMPVTGHRSKTRASAD